MATWRRIFAPYNSAARPTAKDFDTAACTDKAGSTASGNVTITDKDFVEYGLAWYFDNGDSYLSRLTNASSHYFLAYHSAYSTEVLAPGETATFSRISSPDRITAVLVGGGVAVPA